VTVCGHNRVSVEEAKALLDAGYAYLDVRTVEEFAAGHPRAAYNVPLLIRVHGVMQPNGDFLRVVQACFSLEDELVVGCESGGRSLAAAKRLRQLGYSRLVELRPGYRGTRGPFGRVTEAGWYASDMPCSFDDGQRSYRDLLAKLV
jgi:rhodanese-related sulfurtransferase